MRETFHVPARYFLSHSVGCLPRTTQAAFDAAYLEPWRTGANWSEWMGTLDEFRRGIGGLLGVDASTICPQTNVSSALTKIIHSLPRDLSRPVILLSRQDFPTIGFVIAMAERAGYQMRFLDGDPRDANVWAEQMTDDVGIIHITHALSNSADLLPVSDICAQARHAGVVSVVDVAQSLLAVATPATKWQADFVIGTSVKFLCGGAGACFLQVRPERLSDCEPVDVGWFSHDNPFEMDISHFRYADDAMRFFGGTPSPAPFICANAALALWGQFDLDDVRLRIQSHLDRLTDAVPDKHRVSPASAETRGAAYVINPPDRDCLSARLDTETIRYDVRDTGFRFSVHAYTSDDEIEHLAHILGSV